MAKGWPLRLLTGKSGTALLLYVSTTIVLALVASGQTFREHTQFNHFAMLAECWMGGRLELSGAPPDYAAGNDFAFFNGRWFIVFPGAPALLLLPWVKLLGGASHVPDGAVFLMFAGLAPVGLYLTLRRVVEAGVASIHPKAVVWIPVLYAFGTVYFFSAVQGTVWFAAHVVASVATCFFLWASIEARRPLAAGLCLSVVLATRTPLAVLATFYGVEWYRMARDSSRFQLFPTRDAYRNLAWFVFPVALTGGIIAALNYVRFGSIFEFGYRYLSVAWQSRIDHWGLFGYHYLGRNLGALLTSLPYLSNGESGCSLQINGHGLALWLTSPFYLWLLWPRNHTKLHRTVYITLPLAVLPSLLYQNTGWLQFGQRFSNDYAPLLMLLLAMGGFRWNLWLKAACAWAIGTNLFGAITFGQAQYSHFYFIERTQRVLYQPD